MVLFRTSDGVTISQKTKRKQTNVSSSLVATPKSIKILLVDAEVQKRAYKSHSSAKRRLLYNVGAGCELPKYIVTA